MFKSRHLPCKAQNGMVLLLCLIFLTALTLLGLSASAEAILQNKLTANLRETERAKQTAQNTLAFAENWLLQQAGSAPEICVAACTGLKLHAQGSLPENPEFNDISWWQSNGHMAGVDPQSSGAALGSSASSFWVIEAVHQLLPAESGSSDLQVWYRILVRGSSTGAGVSVVESIIQRSWGTIESSEATETEATGLCPGAANTAKCGRVAWRELR